MTRAPTKRPRVGVSACLLGKEVRWDGRHKRDAWLVEHLGRQVEFVPVCPELEVGLGVPREPIHLVGPKASPRLVSQGGVDLTRRMQQFSRQRVEELKRLDLSGYVLKRNSPSCGLRRVPVHSAGGAQRNGVGIFARALLDHFPLLPIEEEADLVDREDRRRFVERVFRYASSKDGVTQEEK